MIVYVRTHHSMPHLHKVNERLLLSERTTLPRRRVARNRLRPTVCLEWRLQVFPVIPTFRSCSCNRGAAALDWTNDECPFKPPPVFLSYVNSNPSSQMAPAPLTQTYFNKNGEIIQWELVTSDHVHRPHGTLSRTKMSFDSKLFRYGQCSPETYQGLSTRNPFICPYRAKTMFIA